MRLIDADRLSENIRDNIPAPYEDSREAKEECLCAIEGSPTVDAVPVVRCKDCEYSYDEISYLCCSHGVCVDCEVPPNFYCAYGKRRAEKEPPEEGET